MKQTTEHQLNILLSDGLVTAPDHFSDQLVQRLSPENDSNRPTQPNGTVISLTVTTPLWQWLALGTASFAGFIQMTAFIFGVWVATAAG